MLKIGLTGGIGSGKTTVANFFAELDIAIIDADKIASDLTAINTDIFKQIIHHFGKNILQSNGALNRQELRHIVFNNIKERQWLENLLHPVIIAEFKKQIQQAKSPYCILVIPLLAETNTADLVDRVLVVDTSLELQLQRAKQRDNASPEIIQAIIQSQADRTTRLALADDIIVNDENTESLHKKVLKLHEFYLQLTQQS